MNSRIFNHTDDIIYLKIARKLKKLTEHLASEEKRDKASAYANGAVGLLREFSEEMAKRKISDLESEFTRSFRQLARKEDVHLRAEIDHRTFAVSLLDGGAANLCNRYIRGTRSNIRQETAYYC